jgi:predicted metal-dependent hydrolase
MEKKTEANIEYSVVRTRRATADVIIERDGSVLVRAPEWASEEEVADIVASKNYWIFKGLAEWRDLNATRVLREYKGGEGFLYLGRSYRLTLADDQTAPLMLKEGRFSLQRSLVEHGELEAARAAFRDFYTTNGRERLLRRVKYFAPKVGVTPTSVDVRELGNRWASCSLNSELAFHWKCMMAPPTVVDYIVVHELCHVLYRDHTDAFWNEVDKVVPSFRERKDWLRKYGASLEL